MAAKVLRDHEIRQALVVKLSAKPDGRILHEVSAGLAKLDVGHIHGGRWSGFEIKSDTDSLERLPLQAFEFDRFHAMTLVTTAKHLSKATALIPAWWGIILAEASPRGRVILKTKRGAKGAPSQGRIMVKGKPARVLTDAERTAGLWARLWAPERRAWLEAMGATKRDWRRCGSEREAFDEIAGALPPKVLRLAVLQAYLDRDPLWAQGANDGRMSAPLVAVAKHGERYVLPDPRGTTTARFEGVKKRATWWQDDLLVCGHVIKTKPSVSAAFRFVDPPKRRCPACRDRLPTTDLTAPAPPV